MPPPKLLLLRSILSTRQCTSDDPNDCDSSSPLTSSGNSRLSTVAIILISIASVIGLLLLLAYIRRATTHAIKQQHTGLPSDHSPYRPTSPLSSHPPAASIPNATRSRSQQQSLKAKKSKFVDPPPVYALENLSETVLERAPGLVVAPARREGEERETHNLPNYIIGETVYRQEGPTVAEAQSGTVVIVKDVSRSEAEAGAGVGR